jgi:hypothetical protein
MGKWLSWACIPYHLLAISSNKLQSYKDMHNNNWVLYTNILLHKTQVQILFALGLKVVVSNLKPKIFSDHIWIDCHFGQSHSHVLLYLALIFFVAP